MLVLCSGNASLALNCLRIQLRDYTKCNTETDITAVRGHKTYLWATKNTTTEHISDWKTNETQNMSRSIYYLFFFFSMCVFSYAENLGIQNKP